MESESSGGEKELINGISSSFIQNKENILQEEEEEKGKCEKLTLDDQCDVEVRNNVDSLNNVDSSNDIGSSNEEDPLNNVHTPNDIGTPNGVDSSDVVSSSNVDSSNVDDSKNIDSSDVDPPNNVDSSTSESKEVSQNGVEEEKDPEVVKKEDDHEEKAAEQDPKNISLHEACKLGNYNLVKNMLDTSTKDVNMADDEGWSCLHETCIHSCQFTKIAELLLNNGADPNLRDSNGETPLHGAVLFHFVDNIRLLLKHNADFTICNDEGVSPLHIAEMTHDEEIQTLLGLPLKKKTPNRRRSRIYGQKKVVLPRRASTLTYTPSPLSSPSILKKRKRNEEEEKDISSPKKRITFSLCND